MDKIYIYIKKKVLITWTWEGGKAGIPELGATHHVNPAISRVTAWSSQNMALRSRARWPRRVEMTVPGGQGGQDRWSLQAMRAGGREPHGGKDSRRVSPKSWAQRRSMYPGEEAVQGCGDYREGLRGRSSLLPRATFGSHQPGCKH